MNRPWRPTSRSPNGNWPMIHMHGRDDALVNSPPAAQLLHGSLVHSLAGLRLLQRPSHDLWGGVQALSPLEVVGSFEAVGGRPFAITHVPVEAFQAQKRAATDSLQKLFAALMLAYADGDSINMRETLKTFPVPPLLVKDYATRAVGRK